MFHSSMFLTRAGEVVQVTKIVRAPLLVSLFACIALFLPDQIREVYRILAQPSRAYGYVQLCFAVLAITAATFVPGRVGHHLFVRHARHLLQQNDLPGVLSRWLPRLCGALIPLGVATGLIIASREIIFELPASVVEANPGLAQLRADAVGVGTSLGWSSALCLVLALFPLLGGVFSRQPIDADGSARPLWPSRSSAILLAAFIALASATVGLAPVAIAEIMGSLAILLIFIVTLVLALGALTAYFDTYRVPAMSCVFLLAVLFSAFGWNDNHAIRLAKRTPARLPSAQMALDAWLDTRGDKDHYGNTPYPVFFVSAAGGGMYAAHHAATVLARLQDRCPNFAQHVFALSGVSGGSLGIAVFASLARHFAPNTEHKGCQLGPLNVGPLEERVQRYFLDADLLAPVVAASLFPDFLQRFLPVKINSFDRAQALEASLADAWPRAAPEKANENPFTRPFLAHWDIANPSPALILNTTDVEYGYRTPITPFTIVSLGEIGNIPTMTTVNEFHDAMRGKDPGSEWEFDQDLTLGAAVGLSARFPWILPAGLVPLAKREARIVDGGYIENSGAETILDLLRTLHRSYHGVGKHKISVHIISISSLQLVERSSWQGIGEILSPLRAMLSTRDLRGILSISHASNFSDDCLVDKSCNQAAAQFNLFPLNVIDFPIPLGWQLSPISASLIGVHSGRANQQNGTMAGSVVDEKRESRIFGYINQANESACAVEKFLHGLRFSDSCG
jgi:hypothetical protein